MNIKEKTEMLMKPAYKRSDVMLIVGCKKTWAGIIMEKCKARHGGTIPGRPSFIKAESLWLYLGTTMDDELRKLQLTKGDGNAE